MSKKEWLVDMQVSTPSSLTDLDCVFSGVEALTNALKASRAEALNWKKKYKDAIYSIEGNLASERERLEHRNREEFFEVLKESGQIMAVRFKQPAFQGEEVKELADALLQELDSIWRKFARRPSRW